MNYENITCNLLFLFKSCYFNLCKNEKKKSRTNNFRIKMKSQYTAKHSLSEDILKYQVHAVHDEMNQKLYWLYFFF